MILQLEDVLDVLYVAFGDKYDFVPLFDHSCGHDRMRPDALNVNCMNVGYGGKSASRMHSSLIREVDGYLGNFFTLTGKVSSYLWVWFNPLCILKMTLGLST